MDVQKTMEFILEQQASCDAQLNRIAENQGRHDREMAEIREDLRRAVSLAIREGRAERQKRRELDVRVREMDARLKESMSQMADAQRETDASLKAFIDSLRKSGNGHE